MRSIKYLIPFVTFLLLSASTSPKIVFDKLEHDLGEVQADSAVTQVFIFHNKGTGTLHIKDIKAGWGCTGTLLSKQEVPAGGSGEIKVTLQTGHYNRKLSKTILVYTDDPDNSTVKLMISCTVINGEDIRQRSQGERNNRNLLDNLYDIQN